jgi:hypothetical protein
MNIVFEPGYRREGVAETTANSVNSWKAAYLQT